MSYDFMLLRVQPRPQALPSPPPESLDASIRALGDLPAIARALDAAGYRQQGWTDGATRYFHRSFDEGGMLSLRLQSDVVAIDTHAHWNRVLELYQAVVAIEPELLLFDPQKFMFHDARSFAAFSDESYRRMAELFPDRAR